MFVIQFKDTINVVTRTFRLSKCLNGVNRWYRIYMVHVTYNIQNGWTGFYIDGCYKCLHISASNHCVQSLRQIPPPNPSFKTTREIPLINPSVCPLCSITASNPWVKSLPLIPGSNTSVPSFRPIPQPNPSVKSHRNLTTNSCQYNL